MQKTNQNVPPVSPRNSPSPRTFAGSTSTLAELARKGHTSANAQLEALVGPINGKVIDILLPETGRMVSVEYPSEFAAACSYDSSLIVKNLEHLVAGIESFYSKKSASDRGDLFFVRISSKGGLQLVSPYGKKVESESTAHGVFEVSVFFSSLESRVYCELVLGTDSITRLNYQITVKNA